MHTYIHTYTHTYTVDGRLCILFMTRRCTDKSLCIPADIKLLNTLAQTKNLPNFVTSDKVKDLDTPHIDITDPEENVLRWVHDMCFIL